VLVEVSVWSLLHARRTRDALEPFDLALEIVTMNGQLPDELGLAIVTAGDPLNACSKASPPHEVGSIGKFESPPCPSCDFVRVREKGLDVALTL
jgi:hypothetical protein